MRQNHRRGDRGRRQSRQRIVRDARDSRNMERGKYHREAEQE
jgi:hypothetical protein